jgi:uncharacterized protein YdcH (DUF465 family)
VEEALMSNENKAATVDDLSPQDQARYAQIKNKVDEMHDQIGQGHANADSVSAGLLERYKDAKLDGKEVSGVYLSQANKYVGNGENIIGVVGDKNNPTNETFHAKSADLIATPPSDHFSRVLEHDRNLQISLDNEKTLQRNRSQEEPTQGAPSMGSRSNLS